MTGEEFLRTYGRLIDEWEAKIDEAYEFEKEPGTRYMTHESHEQLIEWLLDSPLTALLSSEERELARLQKDRDKDPTLKAVYLDLKYRLGYDENERLPWSPEVLMERLLDPEKLGRMTDGP